MRFVLFVVIFTFILNLQAQAQEQDFTVKPVDTNVVLGSTVVLKCSVTAKHGDVQWIHDGTALGYDRKVPGKPRYTVIWVDNEEQEYHLRIANVTLDDEGVYACQVAPIGDWDTKLEAKAKLAVLIAPTNKPEIMFNDEAKNTNEVIHIRESAIKTSKFICKMRRSKPVSQIKWFLNGTQITAALATISDVVTKDSYLEDLTSTLEFKPTTQFNNSLLKCQAYHLAYGLTNEVSNISAQLRLVIVYPPSVPQISGYDITAGVIAGTFLKLVCTSTHRYPPAKLTWFKNKTVIATNYDTIESKTESELQFKVEPVDNQLVFKCDAMNQAIDAPLSSEVKLNVLFGPANAALTGQFEAKAGDTLTATCLSEASNPPAKIRFVFDGFEYEPTAQVVTSAANFGSIVNATFVRSVSREHNGKELKCLVENKEAKIQKVVSKTINILYPPESIELVYPEENKMIIEGRTVRFVCRIKGGNPNADIEWYIGSGSPTSLLTRTKLSALATQTFVTSTESTLELVLKREYHNQPVECIATNKVATLRKSVNINVSYLPLASNVKISLVEPQAAPIKAGTRVVLACTASNSNPEVKISWFKDSYAVLFDNTNEIRSNVTSKLTNDYETVSYIDFIASSNDHNKELRCDVAIVDIPRVMHASYMLNIAFAPELIKPPASVIDINDNASFSLNLTSRANPAPTYSCSASNGKSYAVDKNALLTFVATKADNSEFKCLLTNSESVTEFRFRLNVKFSATVTTNSSLYTATKGDTVNLFCIINANPLELSHIEWKLNAKAIPTNDPRFQSRLDSTSSVAVLSINGVKDTEDGNFSCNVNNKIGAAASASMRVYVKRGPTILDDSVLKAAQDSNEGRSARFICRVHAYPDVVFKWKFPNNSDITNSTKHTILTTKHEHTQIYSSTLNINVVVSTDYGVYICEAKNDIGIQIGKAVLGGKHQPELPSDFRVLNITRNSIHVAWKKNFDGGDTQRFRIRYRKDTIDPTYKYVETVSDQTSIVLDNLEMATRYIINIQSINQFGSEGYLREPLIVQTDFGFNDVNQMPIYNGNDLPLTIILVVCGVGTLLLLFNVILIIYFIRKRKKKGETDSTTGTNETDANTIEMFSPPPPYPDELNYQLELSPNLYEDENKPFVPQTIKYIKKIPNSDNEYSVEYASPMQSWNDGANNELLCDDIYIPSFRDGFMRARAYPAYDTMCNQQTSNIRLGDIERLTIKPSLSNSTGNFIYSSTTAAAAAPQSQSQQQQQQQQGKIYQSLDEFKGHLV